MEQPRQRPTDARLEWSSERALLVRWEPPAEGGLRREPLLLWHRLSDRRAPGVRDLQPGWDTLLVTFDPAVLAPAALWHWVEGALAAPGGSSSGAGGGPLSATGGGSSRGTASSDALAPVPDELAGWEAAELPPLEIPVSFTAADGPDLERVAAVSGLAPGEVIERLLGAELTVAFLGFAPGFPYCAGLPPELATPRLASPRRRVPAGSVAIAGPHLGIYPLATPGGWNLVGRTAVALFAPECEPPSLLAPGRRLRLCHAEAGEPRSRVALGATGPPGRQLVSAEPAGGREAVREGRVAGPSSAGREVAEVGGDAGARWRAGSGGVLEVLEPGLLALVEDLGRPGFAHLGVSACGAADALSLRVGNRLLGNGDGAAALELLLCGGVFRVWQPTRLVLAGADFAARRRTPAGAVEEVRPFAVVELAAGDRLELAAARRGARAYLCVAGGIATPPVLGSRSTHRASGLGGPGGRALRAGDRLPIGAPPPAPGAPGLPEAARVALERQLFREELRVVAGPQASWFVRAGCGGSAHGPPGDDTVAAAGNARPAESSSSSDGVESGAQGVAAAGLAHLEGLLAGAVWVVCEEADRFGVRLAADGAAAGETAGGSLVRRVERELRTEGAPLGAVQWTPDGRLVLLGVDHQTTGGYPKLANVIASDLAALGQLRPRMKIRLTPLSWDDAGEELRAQERWLAAALPGGSH
jgi:allophanate hydrolase subunit 2/allophanate hydrolase subunit 1